MEDVEVMELSELTFPKMRQEFIETMTSLSDREYQQRVWIDKEYPRQNFYDDLTTTVNIFHDLITDEDDFDGYTGTFLTSHDEAQAVEQVYRALDAVIDDLGDSSDNQYLADPRWTDIVSKASNARAVLMALRNWLALGSRHRGETRSDVNELGWISRCRADLDSQSWLIGSWTCGSGAGPRSSPAYPMN